jgi:5-methylthioribose kinase
MRRPAPYRIQTPATLPDLLATLPDVAARLGGGPGNWRIRDIGDGNMNLVFAVTGPRAGVVVKQALPYIRVIGESWPFTVRRIHFEHEALALYAQLTPGRTPAVLHYDPDLAVMVMEYLDSHIVLRKGLLEGRTFPHLAAHLGSFLARTLFLTSDIHLGTAAKRAVMARFDGNEELCATTEDVIFTGPYRDAPLNRWTRPRLDAAVAAIRGDDQAKRVAAELKLLLRTSTQALIHGDFHTGSIMVTHDDTRIIDAEWARYGPIGFDLGAVLGNFLLAYFSQPGHAAHNDDRLAYQDWLLSTMGEIWDRFDEDFRALWRSHGSDLFPPDFFADSGAMASFMDARLASILADAVGFAGAKMIRRIVGISHVEDMEAIADPGLRAACESNALSFARSIMVARHAVRNLRRLTAAARRYGGS